MFDEYKDNIKKNSNASMFARDSYSQRLTPKDEMISSLSYKAHESPYAFNPNLDTSQGLYDLASKVGMREDADRMLEKSGGESRQFFSGGFLMDTMDVLNIASYGMVGVMKGKGFTEGVKNRESFADEDSLGKYGFMGKVAGFVADIVVDPFTWVAPWKIVSKIPGVTKSMDLAKNKLFGELKTIEVDGQKTFQREGGWKPTTLLAEKLVFGMAADRKFLDGPLSINAKADSARADMEGVLQAVNIDSPEILNKAMTRDETGALITRNLDEVKIEMQRELSPDDFNQKFGSLSTLYKMRDDYMKRLVDLKVVSEEAASKHWDTYLTQTYDEYLEAKKLGGAGTKRGIGIESKARVEGMTPEIRKELGQVEDGGIVFGTTILKQIDLIRKAELQKFTADGYALTDDMLAEYRAKGGKMEDLHRVEDSPKYRLRGQEDALLKKRDVVVKELRKVLKERKIAFKDNKEILSTISKMEKYVDDLKTTIPENLSEAFSGVKRAIVKGGSSEGALKKAPTSEGQKVLANSFTKWLNRGSKSDKLLRDTVSTKDLADEFLRTPEGYALQRAFQDPRAMYQWESPLEFLDAIRYPNKTKVVTNAKDELVTLTDAEQLARIKKSEKQARELGKTEHQLEIFKGTNLKLIEDVVNKIEDSYADLLFEKNKILEALEFNKHGQLAGKYVSKEVWETLKGTFDPSKEVGESVVMFFKHAKVVWNPASHVRNAITAPIQNWWRLGIGPWRVDKYYAAYKEIKNNGKIYQEMKALGFSEHNGYLRELLDNYLTSKEVQEQMGLQLGKDRKTIRGKAKHLDRMMTNAYGHTDNIAKVAAYKHGIEQGLSKEDALKAAYEATFNYSEITPFVHKMRRAIWGVPFITFSLKAAPLVAKTLANAPHRISVFGKARNDLFKAAGVEAEQEQEAMPDYMRDDMFMMRLPWKDGKDRSMYFDLTYILPFGSIVTGEYLKNPIGTNPVLQFVKEISTNKTFGGLKIFNESDDVDTVVSDIFLHATKLGLPPLITDEMSQGYDNDGKRVQGKLSKFIGQNTQDLGHNERSFYQEMFRKAGVGVTPYELDSRERAMEYKRKENLSKLLTENGVLKEYRSPYLPKDSVYRPENARPLDSLVDQTIAPK